MVFNVDSLLSYYALHSLFKPFVAVLHIHLIYDDNFRSSRCYVTFGSSSEAQLACDGVASLPIAGCGFKVEFLCSWNIFDSDMDYVPNLFEDEALDPSPRTSHVHPSRLFIVHYRNGYGNSIHAARYLTTEIGTVSAGNLKKYE